LIKARKLITNTRDDDIEGVFLLLDERIDLVG
jgi:hypothetical protein